jgi:2-desacetyl-2-hydroxyethyl bacteriochlorophyllide A dehydrogenase
VATARNIALPAQALRFVAPRRLELVEVAVPEPRPGELLVRAELSGISGGSELLAYRGDIDPHLPRDESLAALAGTFEYPFGYGYSVVGTVEVSRGPLEEGTRVFCFHPHQSRFAVRSDDAVALDEHDPRPATLFPLVETALQICLDAGLRYRETAAVLGLGPVGILTALVLQRAGALVFGSDPRPWRRDAAQRCGIEALAPRELVQAVAAATGGRGLDGLVEASGNTAALSDGLALLAPQGVAIVASWYGQKPVSLPLGGDFHRRRLEIRSSQVSTIGARAARWDRQRRLEVTRRLLAELPLEELCSHTYPLERAAEAFSALDRGDEGLLHVALSYR